MSIEDDIALFETVPILELLGRDALRILAIGAEAINLQAGDMLFRQGADADGGYVVQHGSLELVDENGQMTMRIAAVGTLLGELALIAARSRPLTAIARERCSVVRLPRTLFLKMLEGYPDAAVRLRNALATRIDHLTGELSELQEKFG